MSQPAVNEGWQPRSVPGWAWRAGALVLATVAAYANSFKAAFQFDDYPAILENPALRDLGAFARLLSPAGEGGEYPWLLIKPRWVGDLSFALDLRIWGLDVRGFHLTNLLVHLAAVLLVYRLGVLLLRAPRLWVPAERGSTIAWLAAGAFALHPLQTQAVTYVVQRYASLSTLFVLVAAVAWFEARARWGRGATASVAALTALSVLASALGMVTKEMVVTAPALIALADLLLFEGPRVRRALAWLPLGLTPGLAFAGAVLGRPLLERLSSAGADTGAAMGMTHGDFLLTELRVVATYLRLLIWPAGQNVFWDFPIERSLAAPGVLGALVLVLALLAAAAAFVWWPRASPELRLASWGLAWFFGALAVESGAILIIDVINEHRLYYPLVGGCLGASVGFSAFTSWASQRAPWVPRAAAVLAVLVLLGWGVATARRNEVWARGVTLWEDAGAKAPGLVGPLFMVGLSWEREGAWAEAAEGYRRALALDPRYFPARMGLRAMCLKLGRRECAVHAAATLAFLEGNSQAAARLWQQGLQSSPQHAEMHYGLGLALERLGEAGFARDEFGLGCGLGSPSACAALSTTSRPVPGA